MYCWINEELDSIDFGDQRLDKRARAVLQSLFRDPQASINAANMGWNETFAAYRFFDNDKVSLEKILQAHQQATINRMAELPVVLLVQDSTELNYSDHPPAGAGPLNRQEQLGFLDHSQIAFTPEGLCLGVVHAQFHARDLEGFGQSKQRQHEPLESKETFRWLEGYWRTCDLQPQVPQTQLISIADCEGDLYEVFVEANAVDQPADFVVRAGKIRCLPDKDPTAGNHTYLKMQQQIQKAPIIATRELTLPTTPKRKARLAELQIRAQAMQLKAPQGKSHLPSVCVNVVSVTEVNPPKDGTEVEWLLLTSLPIDEPSAVLAVVDYYTGRWPIEIFFRVLKTGCKIEEIQLETKERLLPCLMLYKIIAWRVLFLTYLGRECPEMPCDLVFADHEWKPVWRICTGKPLPKTPPTLERFLRMLGSLGGYNSRAQDPPPGPQALWIGIRRMTDFANAWLAFGPPAQDKKVVYK